MPIPKAKDSIQRTTAKERIYQEICDWIITGVLKPGEKIIDTEVAAYFNVSRTPVREAVQMLEKQKLVSIIPSCGTVVSKIDVDDIEKAYLPLAEIQGLAAEIACKKITEAELSQLEKLLADSQYACERNDVNAAISHDSDFHLRILEIAGNEYISDFSETLILHIQRIKYHYFHFEPLRKTSLSQHMEILNALKKHDGGLANQLMKEHWLFVMKRSLNDVYEGMAKGLK